MEILLLKNYTQELVLNLVFFINWSIAKSKSFYKDCFTNMEDSLLSETLETVWSAASFIVLLKTLM